MNLNKKYAKSALILALALGITACGGNNESANNTTTEPATTEEATTEEATTEVVEEAETTEEATTEEAATEEETTEEEPATAETGDVPTLVYYNIGATPSRHEEVMAALNEYLDSQNAGYHVNTVFYDWGDYQQKLQLAVNSGEDWDLAFTANWAGPYKTLADQNALEDLTPYLDNELSGAKELIDDRMIEGAKINGPLYGMPAAYPGVVAANQFVWNKEYVDKYDIPYQELSTTQDIEEYLIQVKENEPEAEYPYGVAQDYLNADPVAVFTAASGVGVREEGDKLVAYNVFESDEFKEKINHMKKLYDEGLINPDAPQLQPGEGGGGYYSTLVGQAEGEPGSEAIWSNPGEEKVSNIIGDSIVIDNGKATGKMVSLSSQSEYKEQAIDFINKMFTDPTVQNLLSYGIEGEDYELVDGKVKKMEGEDLYGVASFQYLSMESRTPEYSEDQDDAALEAEVKEFEEKLVASPTLGFNVNRDPIQGELENIDATISRYMNNLKTGAFDESYYDEFIEQLKVAGIDQAIEEIQKQLDEFNK